MNDENIKKCYLLGPNYADQNKCSNEKVCCFECLLNQSGALTKNGTGMLPDYRRLSRKSLNNIIKTHTNTIRHDKCIFAKESCLHTAFMIDITAFKAVNDRLHHDVGDIVIEKANEYLTSISEQIGISDSQGFEDSKDTTQAKNGFLFNYGGDEYIYFTCDYLVCTNEFEHVQRLKSHEKNDAILKKESSIEREISDSLKKFKEQEICIKLIRYEDSAKLVDEDYPADDVKTLFKYSLKGIDFHMEKFNNDDSKGFEAKQYEYESIEELTEMLKEVVKKDYKKIHSEKPSRGFFSKDIKILLGDEIFNPNKTQFYFLICEPGDNSVIEDVYMNLKAAYDAVTDTINGCLDNGNEMDVILSIIKNAGQPEGTITMCAEVNKDSQELYVPEFNKIIDYVEKYVIKNIIQKNNKLKKSRYILYNIYTDVISASPGDNI